MKPLYRTLRYLLQMMYVICFQGRVFGLRHVPQTGGVLLACNHQSFFDPISATIAVRRECNYMARDTLFRNPHFGRLIHAVNAFPVKRGRADVGAVKETLRRLKAGKVVVVFPEGTRTRDGELAPINANSLSIARRVSAAIVPTVIDGAFEAWPRTAMLPRPCRMYVTYCEAISPAQIAEWPLAQITSVVEERLRQGLARSRALRRRAAG